MMMLWASSYVTPMQDSLLMEMSWSPAFRRPSFTRTHTHAHTHTHTHTHTHAHAHKDTHTHTHTRTCTQRLHHGTVREEGQPRSCVPFSQQEMIALPPGPTTCIHSHHRKNGLF